MASTLEKIESNAHNIAKVAQKMNVMAKDIVEVSRRVISIDQSQLAISKTLYAMTEALIAKGLITSEEVMTQLRNLEDKNSKERINQLVKGGLLSPSDSVDENSIVVIKQIQPDGNVFAGYYVIEMSSQMTSPEMKTLLLNKKVGDSDKLIITQKDQEDTSLVCEVIEVYKNVEVKGGEDVQEEG